MGTKSLKGYTREELAELLLKQAKKLEASEQRINELEEELASRQINIDTAGDIAQAALNVNNIFVDAQKAAEEYVLNVKNLDEKNIDIFYKQMESKANKRANEIQENAKKESDILLEKTNDECSQMKELCKKECMHQVRKLKEEIDRRLSS